MPTSKRSISYVATWNNYPDDWKSITTDHVTWFIAGKEVAPTTGTKHLQMAFQLHQEETMFQVNKKFGNKLRLAFPRGNIQSQLDYCSKDGDFEEWGIRPSDSEWRAGKLDEDEIWRLAELGEFDKIPTTIKLNRYHVLKMVHRDYLMRKAECHEELQGPRPHGIFIYGEPGTGKSRLVRMMYRDLCVRGYGERWDLYTGQKYVYFEDIDRERFLKLGGEWFKTLTDRYPIPAKYMYVGDVMIRPKWIVTGKHT